jgi:hypothetical protein
MSKIVIARDGRPLELDRLSGGWHYDVNNNVDYRFVILPGGEHYRQDYTYQATTPYYPLTHSDWYLVT